VTGVVEEEPAGGSHDSLPSHSRVGAGSSLGWRWALLLFVVVTGIQALSPDVQIADSRMTVPTAYAVIHDHTFALNDVPSVQKALRQTTYDVVVRNGRTLPLYPWPPMLLAVPATFMADVAGVHVGTLSPSAPNKTWPIEVPTAAVLVGAATVVMALVALEFVGPVPGARRFAIWVALIFAFATSAWSSASRALWQHTPAMLLCAVALLAALRSRRDRRFLWVLGGSLALSYTTRPTMAVVLLALGAWAIVVHRRDAWRAVLAAVVVAVPFVIVNLDVYHSVLAPYYTGSGNGFFEWYGFFESLGVQMVSPSRGLLVYTPMYLLIGLGMWMTHRERRLTVLDIAIAVAVLLEILVNTLSGSTEGTAYGSRFFTDVVPLLLYLCLPVFQRLILSRDLPRLASAGAVTLTSLSVLVAAPGALTHSALCWSATPRLVTDAPERVWSWSDPQFLRPVRLLVNGASIHNIVLGSCPASVRSTSG
jgi:hypothetical protein